MSNVIIPRVKSVENMVARARAVTSRPPTVQACHTCHVTLWLSFFFDGTNNNRDRDFPKCHSNIAALYDAHLQQDTTGITPFYYEGVGTTFEFNERFEEGDQVINGVTVTVPRQGYTESGTGPIGLAGKGFGTGIDKRLEKAIFEFEDAVEEWRRLRRVDAINIAVFGFSRGATTARAFMHWLAAQTKVTRSGDSLSYDGVPLKIKFLGLFDTVESIDWPGANLEAKLIKTSIPSFVEKCTHIVAAHELRAAFPLTVLGTERFKHVVYPGAHADVGGGYESGEQGRSSLLARIALLQMLDEARGAGLKMMSLGEMRSSKKWEALLSQSFDVPPTAIKALNAYIAAVKPSGSVQQHFEAHMKHYWDWIDAGLAADDIHAKKKQLNPKAADYAARKEDLKVMRHLLFFEARTEPGRRAPDVPAKQGAVPAAVEHLLENYVHDSFEHFSVSGGTMQQDLSLADYYHTRKIVQPT